MKTYKFDFNNSYNQFYIADKNYVGDTGSDKFWTEEAYEDRIAITDDLLGIGTESYGHIKGEVNLFENAPSETDFTIFDHIAEAGLEIQSGLLQFIDCPNSMIVLEFDIQPGTYRIRVCSANLSSADIDEEEGNDYYIIEIWPDTNVSKNILKRYTPPWKQ
jgi:hypothetical protein